MAMLLRCLALPIIALVMGVRLSGTILASRSACSADPGSLWQADEDAGQLRYIRRGCVACVNETSPDRSP